MNGNEEQQEFPVYWDKQETIFCQIKQSNMIRSETKPQLTPWHTPRKCVLRFGSLVLSLCSPQTHMDASGYVCVFAYIVALGVDWCSVTGWEHPGGGQRGEEPCLTVMSSHLFCWLCKYSTQRASCMPLWRIIIISERITGPVVYNKSMDIILTGENVVSADLVTRGNH